MNTTVVTMSPNTILLSLEQYEEFRNQKENFEKILEQLGKECNVLIETNFRYDHISIEKISDEELRESYKTKSEKYKDLLRENSNLKYDVDFLKTSNNRLKSEIEALKKKKSWF